MIKKKIANTTFFLFPNFLNDKELIHAISTREAGVSSSNYESLNLSFQVGDADDNVMENHRIVSHALGFDLRSLATGQQIHHDNIAMVDERHLKKDCFLPDNAFPKTDALVTDVPGLTLMTRYADCVPLLFYDPKTHTVATAHAGWKGTLLHIAQKTVDVLVKDYHCQPQHIRAAIGPSIGPCCYRINSTMAGEAVRVLHKAQQYFVTSTNDDLYFNLWQANKKQLQHAGIKDDHLSCAELCTSCNIDLFYSYRKEKQVTGRFGALIGRRR